MKTPISLRDLQVWMKWIVTDPRGVDAALADPNPKGLEPAARYTQPSPIALDCIAEQPPLAVSDRLSIYAEAYFSRILEAMEHDFPRLRRVLGEQAFQKLVADYLKVHPSRTPNIGEVGSRLAAFLRDDPSWAELPFLPSLANLEWQSIECFYAPDDPAFDAQALAHLPESDWQALCLKFSHSAKLLVSRWPLMQLWRWAETDAEIEVPEESATQVGVLMWRHQGVIRVADLADWEQQALERLLEGARLSVVMDELAVKFVGDADLPRKIQACFQLWWQAGIVVGIG